MINFTDTELEDILNNKYEEWITVAVNRKGDERVGVYEEIVFTHLNGTTPFYAFTYYIEEDFEPSDVYTVFPKEITIVEWTRVND